MPFYEYECASCKFYTEVMQKISDAPLEKCPSCGKKALKKLVSAPVFRLKGGGWYETDFKSDKENKRNLADREEPAAAKPEDGKTDESKPAAGAETTGQVGGPAAGQAAAKAGASGSEGAAKAIPAASAGSSSVRRPAGTSTSKSARAKSGSTRAKPVAKPAAKGRTKTAARKKARR
jgi:putative FmdB family regulatory protein